jgi:hypothetical protein
MLSIPNGVNTGKTVEQAYRVSRIVSQRRCEQNKKMPFSGGLTMCSEKITLEPVETRVEKRVC